MNKNKEKEENINGCGGKGGTIKPPHSIFFETSCNIHDINYNIGGTEEDRKRADRGLMKYMYKDVLRLKLLARPHFFIWIILYYLAVRIFGSRYFNYTTNNA